MDWMLLQAKMAGLRFDDTEEFATGPGQYKGRDIRVNKSLTKWYWWIPEYLPLRRLMYEKDKKGNETTRR